MGRVKPEICIVLVAGALAAGLLVGAVYGGLQGHARAKVLIERQLLDALRECPRAPARQTIRVHLTGARP